MLCYSIQNMCLSLVLPDHDARLSIARHLDTRVNELYCVGKVYQEEVNQLRIQVASECETDPHELIYDTTLTALGIRMPNWESG